VPRRRNRGSSSAPVLTEDQLTAVMRQINGPDYSTMHAIASRYIKRKLHDRDTPSLRTRITSLIVHACLDFMRRDSAAAADTYRHYADVLDEALNILAREDARYFASLMAFRVPGQKPNRAIWAMKQMADGYRRHASDYDRDKKNITFFYCLGKQFGSRMHLVQFAPPLAIRLAIPSAGEANAAYKVLIGALANTAPNSVRGLKTDYGDEKEIRASLRSGYAKAQRGVSAV